MQEKKVRLPIKYNKKATIDSIMRVNHAGEYGAKRIYEGQLAVIRDHSTREQILKMHNQELQHLEYFEKQIVAERARPTVLLPLWHIGGFALGAITGLLGKKSAMLCTHAVEEVIAKHYQEQIDLLNDSQFSDHQNLKASITNFREEELEHKDIAEEHDAMQAPFNKLITNSIQSLCKLAIFLSKRI